MDELDPFDDEEVEDDDPFDELEVDEDEETLPDEEVEDDTLPDEDEDTLPLDEDETLPEDDDEVLPDEKPPVDDDVELDPPELDEVDEIAMPPLPPPPPPKKPPAKKPPPPPQPPPLPPTTGTSPLDPVKAGGIGTGAPPATVTIAGGQVVVVVTTLRTRDLATLATRARTTRFLYVLAYAGRAFGAPSATLTAPPPIMAPPHAQAQSLAMAIRTDIASTLC